MTYEKFGALLGVIASQNKESFPSYEAYTQYLQSLRDSTSMSISLLLTTSTNSQQVNTLAEEFLDYNEDEANLNISPEVVHIEEIIDDLKTITPLNYHHTSQTLVIPTYLFIMPLPLQWRRYSL